jgi:nucleoside-diphosphate-sugar epimerase
MKVLVLGASGFLGKSCVQLFRSHNYKVITSDKVGEVDIIGDLSDPEFSASLPDADIIVNCAAVQYVSADIPILFRKNYFYKNNVLTAKNLYNRYKDSSSRFIHIGTSMMYHQNGSNIYTSKSTMRGEGVYSCSKIDAQAFINKLSNVATVIPCIIGGEGRGGLFTNFIRMIQKYCMVFFPGAGKHQISMVHVDDVASLVLVLSKKSVPGFYNAAAPEPLSISEWIDEIALELEIKSSLIRKVSLPLLPIKLLATISGYRLLASEQLLMLKMPHVLSIQDSIELGWTPSFNNAQIVRDIARHISLENT